MAKSAKNCRAACLKTPSPFVYQSKPKIIAAAAAVPKICSSLFKTALTLQWHFIKLNNRFKSI